MADSFIQLSQVHGYCQPHDADVSEEGMSTCYDFCTVFGPCQVSRQITTRVLTFWASSAASPVASKAMQLALGKPAMEDPADVFLMTSEASEDADHGPFWLIRVYKMTSCTITSSSAALNTIATTNAGMYDFCVRFPRQSAEETLKLIKLSPDGSALALQRTHHILECFVLAHGTIMYQSTPPFQIGSPSSSSDPLIGFEWLMPSKMTRECGTTLMAVLMITKHAFHLFQFSSTGMSKSQTIHLRPYLGNSQDDAPHITAHRYNAEMGVLLIISNENVVYTFSVLHNGSIIGVLPGPMIVLARSIRAQHIQLCTLYGIHFTGIIMEDVDNTYIDLYPCVTMPLDFCKETRASQSGKQFTYMFAHTKLTLFVDHGAMYENYLKSRDKRQRSNGSRRILLNAITGTTQTKTPRSTGGGPTSSASPMTRLEAKDALVADATVPLAKLAYRLHIEDSHADRDHIMLRVVDNAIVVLIFITGHGQKNLNRTRTLLYDIGLDHYALKRDTVQVKPLLDGTLPKTVRALEPLPPVTQLYFEETTNSSFGEAVVDMLPSSMICTGHGYDGDQIYSFSRLYIPLDASLVAQFPTARKQLALAFLLHRQISITPLKVRMTPVSRSSMSSLMDMAWSKETYCGGPMEPTKPISEWNGEELGFLGLGHNLEQLVISMLQNTFLLKQIDSGISDMDVIGTMFDLIHVHIIHHQRRVKKTESDTPRALLMQNRAASLNGSTVGFRQKLFQTVIKVTTSRASRLSRSLSDDRLTSRGTSTSKSEHNGGHVGEEQNSAATCLFEQVAKPFMAMNFRTIEEQVHARHVFQEYRRAVYQSGLPLSPEANWYLNQNYPIEKEVINKRPWERGDMSREAFMTLTLRKYVRLGEAMEGLCWLHFQLKNNACTSHEVLSEWKFILLQQDGSTIVKEKVEKFFNDLGV